MRTEKEKKGAHSFIGVSILSSQLEECFQLNSTKFKPKLCILQLQPVAANCLQVLDCTQIWPKAIIHYAL